MKFLGIDQSLRETGWLSYDAERECEESGTITPDPELAPIDRLDVLETRLRWLIEAQRPTVIAIEGYAYCGPGRARELGELGGVLRVILIRSGIRTYEISPGSLKKFVTGKGSGDKAIMLLQTFKRFGVEFSNHNICDAFGLCVMACLLEKQANIHVSAALTKPQEEALKACNLLVKAPAILSRNRVRSVM